MLLSRTGILVPLLLASLPPLPAETVSLAPVRDNSIYEDLQDNSSGAGQFVIAGVTKGGWKRRGLIAFDLAGAVPAGAVVNFVQLTLTIAKVPDELLVGTTHSLHRTEAGWGAAGSEGTGRGEPAQPGDATWTQNFFGSSDWATPGGDFAVAASASAPVSPLINDEVVFASLGLIADVQLWVDDPLRNHGWTVVGNEAFTANARAYYSADNADTIRWPELVVGYDPVPEPAAAGWVTGLAMALALALRGRPY